MAGDSNKGVKGSKNIMVLRKKIDVLYKFKTVIDYLIADLIVQEPVTMCSDTQLLGHFLNLILSNAHAK